MLFAAGMGIGLVFWGVAEPLNHFAAPPPGTPDGEAAAARAAMDTTFLHWGLHVWAIYAIIALGRWAVDSGRVEAREPETTVAIQAPCGLVRARVQVQTVGGARNDTYYRSYEWSWLEVFVRRKPDVSIEQANADLTEAYRRSWTAEREVAPIPDLASAQPRAELTPVQLARTPDAGGEARTLVWVMGVAGIVLLIACANVANLLLARALKRRREIGLRLALGVSRGRLAQQLLVETLVLAALGGAFGLIVAQWGGRTLAALFLPDRPADVASDLRTLLFAIALTMCVAVATGLAPAVQSFRYDLAGALRAGSRDVGYRRSRLRSALLLFQGALCVMLLVGAGVFSRSLWNVRSMRLGYDVDPIVSWSVPN